MLLDDVNKTRLLVGKVKKILDVIDGGEGVERVHALGIWVERRDAVRRAKKTTLSTNPSKRKKNTCYLQ